MKLTRQQISELARSITKAEVMRIAREDNIQITEDEAEEFLKQFSFREFSEEDMKLIAGGGGVCPVFCSKVEQCVEDDPFMI